jgi:hypothetical protein
MSPPRRSRLFTSCDDETIGRSWSVAVGGVRFSERCGLVRVVLVDEDAKHVLEVAAVQD